jgi:hypothetical protein
MIIEKIYALKIGKIGFRYRIWQFYLLNNLRKKIIIFIGENWWTQIDFFLMGKGLPDMHNHEFEQNWSEQVVLVIKC